MNLAVRRPLTVSLAAVGLVAALAAPASAATYETVTSLRQAHAGACYSEFPEQDQTSVMFRHDPRDVKRGVSRTVVVIVLTDGRLRQQTQWQEAGARPREHRYTLPEGETFTRLRVTVEFKNGDTRSNRISRAALDHC